MEPRVYYTWGPEVLRNKFDPGFDRSVKWDIPLLEGYEYTFPENMARKKGSHHFSGINNPELIRDIEGWQPDAILVYGWKFRSHIAVMRHFHSKIPVWFRGDSTLLDEKPGLNAMIKRHLLRWVYRHVDTAFYTGSANKEYFLRQGMRPEQLTEALHAIDNEHFSDIEGLHAKDAGILRDKLQIPMDAFVFLYAGKLVSKKGVESLMKAFQMLNQKGVHLVITGNGPIEGRLKNKYGNFREIHFMNFRNQGNMPSVYRVGNVFVLPSIGPGETWGLGINEAMACGSPVIVSDKCGGAKDLVEDGKNGYIFKAGNIEDLAARMNMMIEKQKDICNLGLHSLEIIKKFTFQKMASAVENQFDSIVRTIN